MLLFRCHSFSALLSFFTLTSAAAITNPPNLLLTATDLSNTSLPSNQTISPPSKFVQSSPPPTQPKISPSPTNTLHRPHSTLPPSPYIYPIPTDPSITLTFSTYTAPISELAAIQCILSATEDVETALEAALRDADPDSAVRQRYIRIDAEHATLVVALADGQMKWTTWSKALKALTAFLYAWEFVGLRFVVVEAGAVVAAGVLAGT